MSLKALSWMPTQNSVWQTGCTCKYFLHEWTSQITNYWQEKRLFMSLCWWPLWNRNLCFLLVSAKADTDSLVFLPFCKDTVFHVPILNCDAPKRHAPVPDGGPSGLGLPQTSPSLCPGISYSHWVFACHHGKCDGLVMGSRLTGTERRKLSRLCESQPAVLMVLNICWGDWKKYGIMEKWLHPFETRFSKSGELFFLNPWIVVRITMLVNYLAPCLSCCS